MIIYAFGCDAWSVQAPTVRVSAPPTSLMTAAAPSGSAPQRHADRARTLCCTQPRSRAGRRPGRAPRACPRRTGRRSRAGISRERRRSSRSARRPCTRDRRLSRWGRAHACARQPPQSGSSAGQGLSSRAAWPRMRVSPRLRGVCRIPSSSRALCSGSSCSRLRRGPPPQLHRRRRRLTRPQLDVP
jgi:hypothetical protein